MYPLAFFFFGYFFLFFFFVTWKILLKWPGYPALIVLPVRHAFKFISAPHLHSAKTMGKNYLINE